MTRQRIILAACALLPSSLGLAQQGGDGFGTCVARVDDLDCDGSADFAVGAPDCWIPAHLDGATPRVFVYSGRTGALIRELASASPERIGMAVASAPDIDGDGFGEIVSGRAVFSGFSGREILAMQTQTLNLAATDPSLSTDVATYELHGMPCLAPPAPPGEAKSAEIDRLFWSPAHEENRRVIEAAFELVRPRVDAAGELGWPMYSLAPSFLGSSKESARLSVEVVPSEPTRIQYAVVLRSSNSEPALVFPGRAIVAWIGDVDRDGSGDFALRDRDRIELRSGRTGAWLRSIFNTSRAPDWGDSITGGGDLDADGIPDVLVGTIGDISESGMVEIFSGATGRLLSRINGEWLGASLSFLGDVDGDGVSDFAAGALWYWADGPPPGAVNVYSGRTRKLLYRVNSPYF